jgi:hypothetical protein
MRRQVMALILISSLTMSEVAKATSTLEGSNSSTANPLIPECKRPSSISAITSKTNSKYDELKAPKQTQLATLDAQIVTAKAEMNSKKAAYEAAVKNTSLSPESVANYRTQYETAATNVKNYESQRSVVASDIISLEGLRSQEISNINAFKQYDTVEAYLEMAVFNEDSIYGSKGLEILAVADVGRRLSCNIVGDTTSGSYSLFKDASNAFSVNFAEDTYSFLSAIQESLISECENASDAKEAQYEALKVLRDRQQIVLEAITNQISSIEALADSYLPALEAARAEQADKSTRINDAEAWVAEAQSKVDKEQAEVDAAKEKVAQAEDDLAKEEKELEIIKQANDEARDKKEQLLIAAAAAAALALMMDKKAAAAKARAAATGGVSPDVAAAEAEAKAAQRQKILLAAAAALAVAAFMQKEEELDEQEAKVEEAKKALETAENELAAQEEELATAEDELALAQKELELANTHTSLSCTVTGGSELLQSLSNASANSNSGSLDSAKASADGHMISYISAHNARQPSEFPATDTRITYLEYVVTLSSAGVSELNSDKAKAEAYIEEITGIMNQMNSITVTDFSSSLATSSSSTFCLDSKGNLDQSCSCQVSNTCLNASTTTTSTSTDSGSSQSIGISAYTLGSTSAVGSTSGTITLASATSLAGAAQTEYVNAIFSGNQSAAKVARDKLKKYSKFLRENNPLNKDLEAKYANKLKSSGNHALPLVSNFESSYAGSSFGVMEKKDRSRMESESLQNSSFGLGGVKIQDLGGSRSPASSSASEDTYAFDQSAINQEKLKSDTEVAKSSGPGLFEIISSRYQKSAYPKLFQKITTAGPLHE